MFTLNNLQRNRQKMYYAYHWAWLKENSVDDLRRTAENNDQAKNVEFRCILKIEQYSIMAYGASVSNLSYKMSDFVKKAFSLHE